MTAPRVETILRALSVFFAILAVTALLWPVSAPRDEIAPAGLSVPASGTPLKASDPTITQSIVAANIFSAARTPPRSRYNPFEPDPIAPEPLGGGTVVDMGVVSAEDVVPSLFGIVSSPAGATALMRLDPAIPEAVLYREGDRAGRYRVVKINPQSVILSGPRGQTVLQLKRPEGP